MEIRNISKHPTVYLGQKVFTIEDQLFFAKLSGDSNPMHVDAIASRRLIAGAPVVHGMHLVLVALNLYVSQEDFSPISGIQCKFINPVVIGEVVEFLLCAAGEDAGRIDIKVDGALCSQLTLLSAGTGEVVEIESAFRPTQGSSFITLDYQNSSPVDMDLALHLNRQYVLLPTKHTAETFSDVSSIFGSATVSGLLGLSYIVGMVCPGLHSIFASFSVQFPPSTNASEGLRFLVAKIDDRFKLVEVAIQGDVTGKIGAFQRPAPVGQPPIEEIRAFVADDEFKSTYSLVIGGSRGLGEIATKILALGGANTLITYATGSSDAEKIRCEIDESKIGKCEVRRFNLLDDDFQILEPALGIVDSIYFFATPRIARRKSELFEYPIFSEFSEFYVARFYRLCKHLESTRKQKIKIYYPSTVYISERPRNLSEYAMAKAAAEVLIEDINRNFKKVSVFATRLPRLSTDQTSGILSTVGESNIETILEIVRMMNSPL